MSVRLDVPILSCVLKNNLDLMDTPPSGKLIQKQSKISFCIFCHEMGGGGESILLLI